MTITLEQKIRAIEKQLLECGKRIARASAETESNPRAHETLHSLIQQEQALTESLVRLKAQQQ